MATGTPKRFSVQQVFEMLLQKPATGEVVAYLDDLKKSSVTNEATTVYPTGGRGNTYIGSGFAHSRKAKIEASKATWNTSLMASQLGSVITTGVNTKATWYDQPITNPNMIVTVAGEITTKYKATGTTNAEIGTLYPINADGTYGAPLTQMASTPTAGKFAYASATRKITFYAGEGLVGNQYACAYTFSTGATAQTISIKVDSIPDTVNVTAFGLVKDICTGDLYPCEIKGLAQIDPNWKWDLASDGEPAVQDFSLTFVRGCGTKELYEIIVFEGDITYA